MKSRFKIVLTVASLFILCLCLGNAQAQQADLPVAITFPQGTVAIHVSKVIANPPYNGTTDTWPALGAASETTMSFGTLKELRDSITNAPLGVFGPQDGQYYAIDVAVSGGGFPPSVNVTTGFSGDNIGANMSATYVHVKYDPVLKVGIDSDTIVGPVPLNQSVSLGVADFTGQWSRIYVGLVVPPAPPATLPSNLFPWTADMAVKTYSANFTIYGAGFPV